MELQDVVRDFLVESYENLDQIDRDLLVLEQDPTSQSTLASVFRTIHTIKGTCGFLGFGKLESVSHAGESLLSKLRDGEMRMNSDIATGLLTLVDAVRTILASIEASGAEGDQQFDDLVAALHYLQASGSLPSEASPPSQKTGPSKPAKAPQTAKPKSKKQKTAPAVMPGEPSVPESLLTPVAMLPNETAAPRETPRAAAPAPAETNSVPPEPPRAVVEPPRATTPAADGAQLADANIRVDVGLLDRLMNQVGELVLARNQILQFGAQLKNPAFQSTSQRLNLITTELQESVMKTRMQPIGNIWMKFPRVVRDLAMMCGKQVRIEMEGKETDLDKTIIESIKDPLTHLVRNSVDHGIEQPDARMNVGKAPEGVIRLRAFHEGGQVIIEIADDGAGLNLKRIADKAVERGLVHRGDVAQMSERELAQLIFLPGFSTAEKLTNISGRGVGMDVVKTNIEKIGGTVEISSLAGQGTTIRIKIPLTLAIIPALIVTCAGERFAIPQVSLRELVRLEGGQAQTAIERLHGAAVYRLRGRLLPLVYLSRVLQLNVAADATANRAVNIIVLQADDRQFGLVVDAINDTEEIVVKPLSKQLKGVPCFAGATIMGDGRVALILDMVGLAQAASVVGEQRGRARAETAAATTDAASEGKTLLLVGLGPQRRAAVPLSLVARLEEIPTNTVELLEHQEVVQYRGEIIPLLRLADVLGVVGSEGDGELLQVVVYSQQGHSVGLVVDRILDIVDGDVTIQHAVEHGGLRGAAVIQSKVTEMLDISALVRAHFPHLFTDPAAVAQEVFADVH